MPEMCVRGWADALGYESAALRARVLGLPTEAHLSDTLLATLVAAATQTESPARNHPRSWLSVTSISEIASIRSRRLSRAPR
jgi:hypothetical protein